SVAERKKEIGTLRALGATKEGILKLILSEALVMGAVGAFAGTWMGRALASTLVSQVSRAISDQLMNRVEVSRLVFGPADFARGVATGAMVSLLAALLPALKAMRITPLEAMKRHSEPRYSTRSRIFKYTAWAAVLMLGYYQFSSMRLWGTLSPVLA